MTIRNLITATMISLLASSLALGESFSSTDKQTNLIELYTSEGCSSCPPADKWLNSLKGEQGLWTEFIPLAFHVDYWDYIGWKDPFADPSYTQRQYRYNEHKIFALSILPVLSSTVRNGVHGAGVICQRLIAIMQVNSKSISTKINCPRISKQISLAIKL